MGTSEDLNSMIEALTLTIAIHEREELFFRRSASVSSSQEVKTLFLEIADEMNHHLTSLKARRRKLADRLGSLRKA